MYKGLDLEPPFFHIGIKAFKYGKEALSLARSAEKASGKYSVDVIISPQYADLRLIAESTDNLFVFAQHMDPQSIGEGHGSVLPESLKEAGASGVILNHAAKPLNLSEISKAVNRADDLNLATVVCADRGDEAAAVANFSPNIVLAEPKELIGTGETSDRNYIKSTRETIKQVHSGVKVLQGAGVSNGQDVYDLIEAGAEGVGAASGIMQAESPEKKIDEMIQAARRAWGDSVE